MPRVLKTCFIHEKRHTYLSNRDLLANTFATYRDVEEYTPLERLRQRGDPDATAADDALFLSAHQLRPATCPWLVNPALFPQQAAAPEHWPSYKSFISAATGPLFAPPVLPPGTSQKQLYSWQRAHSLLEKGRLSEAEHVCPASDFKYDTARTRKPRPDARQLRCKNATMVYHLLDPLDKGYVDLQEATELLITKAHSGYPVPCLNVIVSIVEDLQPFASSRGVVEKDVCLSAITRFIEETGLSSPIYGKLRGVSRSFHAQLRYRPTTVSSKALQTENLGRAFYRSPTWPGKARHTTRRKNVDADGSLPLLTVMEDDHDAGTIFQNISALYSANNVTSHSNKHHWGPVNASLAVHGTISNAHRQLRIEQLKAEQEKKLQETCPFHPVRYSKRLPAKSTANISDSVSPIHSPRMSTTEKEKVFCSQPNLNHKDQLTASPPLTHPILPLPSQPKSGSPFPLTSPKLPRPVVHFQPIQSPENEPKRDDCSHFVLHVGEPPPAKTQPWHTRLRRVEVHQEHTVGRDMPTKCKRFDALSRPMALPTCQPSSAPRCDLKSNTAIPALRQANWTPKMAFEKTGDPSDLEHPVTGGNFRFFLNFARPYTKDSPDPGVSTSEDPTGLSPPKAYHLRAHYTPPTLPYSLPDHSASQLRYRSFKTDPLLWRMRVTDAVKQEEPAIRQTTNWGDISRKKPYKHRGTSEWVNSLRGGYCAGPPCLSTSHLPPFPPNSLLQKPGPLRGT